MNFTHRPSENERKTNKNLVFGGLAFNKYIYVAVIVDLDLWFSYKDLYLSLGCR